jgi:very-short-patch-repair endonuclease
MTLPEVLLWEMLRQGRLAALRFRRQHPIGPYILDFYCAAARLAVEIDGMAHDAAARVQHDEHRQLWLGKHGVTVLRIAANDVLRDDKLEVVLIAIEQAAAAPSASPGSSPGSTPPPRGGGGSMRGGSACERRGKPSFARIKCVGR